MKSIKVGDQAPDVILATHDGRRFSLADFQEKQAVVLFFYPKDNSRICTREACSFRDAYEEFVEAGAVVIGVSGDSIESHREFADEHQLPYLLVADTDGAVRRAFGVPKTLGLIPGRVTYVIDREGVVQSVFNAPLQSQRHVDEALKTVRDLNAGEV
ncbi:MAG: peroxiredoxin [Pirellulales bacterium]